MHSDSTISKDPDAKIASHAGWSIWTDRSKLINAEERRIKEKAAREWIQAKAETWMKKKESEQEDHS